MSLTSQTQPEGGGRRSRARSSRDETVPVVDDSLLPLYAKHLEYKMKEYIPEGDIEFPFEDTSGAGDENRVRGNWASRADSFVAIAGFTFGLGNFWRFPFLVYKFGGAAFFIPFLLCLLVIVVPTFVLECALGQFSSLAAVSVWKVVPLFKGVGVAMVFIACVMSVYLNVVTSWTLFYLFNSVGFSLPWSTCDNSWSGMNCSSSARLNCLEQNGTLLLNGSCLISVPGEGSVVMNTHSGRFPSLEYFQYLGICLLIAYICCFLCLFQSVKSSGKVAYVLVVLPLIIIVVLIARLLTVEGSLAALITFLTPDFSVLQDPTVWGEAAMQAFYSLACCTGGLVTLSSYNTFHSNIFKNVWLICVFDIVCSLASCCLTFTAIGFTCKQLGIPLDKFQLKEGAHVLFVLLSETVSGLPVAPLYATAFFLMLYLVLLSTQIFVVETIVSSICDHYAEHLRRNRRHVLALVCVALIIISVPFCTSAGLYWIALLDRFALSWPLIILAFIEVTAISWVYGVDNLLDNVKWMTGSYPPVYLLWKLLWKYICPLVYLSLLSLAWLKWESLSYESYAFPYWTSLFGVGFAAIPLMIVLVAAVVELATTSGSFMERWRNVLNPDDAWGPALAIHRSEQFPLQIPEARRMLLADDDIPNEKWKDSREETIQPSSGVSMERMSRGATIASLQPFERETAI